MILDLPIPPSVNRTRRINWAGHRAAAGWKRRADQHVLMAKRRAGDRLILSRIARFELTITLDRQSMRKDPDNILKVLLDYLVTIELIANDGYKNMEAISIRWGDAPEGCRVQVERVD